MVFESFYTFVQDPMQFDAFYNCYLKMTKSMLIFTNQEQDTGQFYNSVVEYEMLSTHKQNFIILV